MLTVAFILIAYLIGSIPFAVIVSRFFKLKDPRTFGSGNPGATNVLRTGHKSAALLTLLGDAFKGTSAVIFAKICGIEDLQMLAWIGFSAFMGHIFPIFLKFKGGKGVSTALGVLLGLSPLLAFLCLALWTLVALTTRTSSLAAIIAALGSPVIAYLLKFPVVALIPLTLMSCILIIRHKMNIIRIIQGKESKISKK